MAKTKFTGMIEDLERLGEFLAAGHTLEEAQAAGLCRITKLALPQTEGAVAARQARSALKLSQPEFAEFLGVSSQSVKAWEQARKVPTPPVLRMLKHIAQHPKTWKAKV
jgi:putative transcriptional regulator